MDIPYKVRKEMEELSKVVFGSRSKYKKFIDNGIPQMVTKKVMETVPGVDGAPDTTKEVEVDVLDENGVKQIRVKHFTVDQMFAWMIELKTTHEAMVANIQAQQAAAQAQQQLERQLQSTHSGSAL
jgi:NADPH-dependent 7-cyano-7-deazaguanine reductase QueF-like protein